MPVLVQLTWSLRRSACIRRRGVVGAMRSMPPDVHPVAVPSRAHRRPWLTGSNVWNRSGNMKRKTPQTSGGGHRWGIKSTGKKKITRAWSSPIKSARWPGAGMSWRDHLSGTHATRRSGTVSRCLSVWTCCPGAGPNRRQGRRKTEAGKIAPARTNGRCVVRRRPRIRV